MRRRRWIRWVRTLSLAILIASVGLWVVSEFGWCIVTTPFASLGIYNGSVTINNIPGLNSPGQIPPIWSQWYGFRGLHFGQFSSEWGHEFSGISQPWVLISIPFWGVSLLAIGAWLACTILLRRTGRLPGMCPNCGYDASRCTEGRCSECGRPLPDPSPVDATA